MPSRRIQGITIEIDGNVTKLNKALSSVDKSLKTTQGNLKDIDKLLKFDPTNTTLLTQKQQELQKQVTSTKDRLQQLKDAQSQVGSGTAEWDALQREIIETEQNLKNAKKALDDFGSVSAQQLKAVGEKVSEAGAKISDVGETMTQKVTLPIVAGFTAAIKTTADFDSQMSKVKAISGANAEEFDRLRQTAIDMGEATLWSATDAGEAFEYMAMAGWDVDEMLAGIEPIMKLATAAGENLGTTSDIVTDALTAFGLAADDTGHFTDVLAAASANANTNVSMLGESFKYVAPVAGAMGYSAEDVALALGLMANAGIKASQGGTALRRVLSNMANPSDKVAAAMDRCGISLSYFNEQTGQSEMYSFLDLMYQMREGMQGLSLDFDEYGEQLDEIAELYVNGSISEEEYLSAIEDLTGSLLTAEEAQKAQTAAIIGGGAGMSGLLAIVNASDEEFEALADSIRTASDATALLADGSIVPLDEALASGQEIIQQFNGTADQMAYIMGDNLTGKLQILESKLQTLAIAVGDLLMPFLEKLVVKLQDAVSWFNNLDKPTQEAIVKITLLAAAIGPALLIIGKVVTVLGTLMSALGAVVGVLGGTVVAAIAAVIAAGVLLYTHWDKVQQIATAMQERLTAAWEAIKTGWSDMVSSAIESLNNMTAEITSGVDSAIAKFDELRAGVSEKWEAIKSTISSAIENIKGMMNFEWKLPDIKLPHFSISGDFSLVPPFSVPSFSVSWYKDAYTNPVMFTQPTVLQTPQGAKGFGDGNGAEIVLGLNKLRELVGMDRSNNVNVNVYGAQGQDEQIIANKVAAIIYDNVIDRGTMFT